MVPELEKNDSVNLAGILNSDGLAQIDCKVGEKARRRAEMQSWGIPTPEAVVLPHQEKVHSLKSAVRNLELHTGKKFGDTQTPLILTANSSSDLPYPGLLRSVLFIGITPEYLQNLKVQDEEKALRIELGQLQSFSKEVFGLQVDGREIKGTEIDILREKILSYKQAQSNAGVQIPVDPFEQMRLAYDAVRASSNSHAVKAFRNSHRLEGEAPISVILSEMVPTFSGNSCIGEVASFNRETGEYQVNGHFRLRGNGASQQADVLHRLDVSELPDRLKTELECYMGTIAEKTGLKSICVEFLVSELEELYLVQYQPQAVPLSLMFGQHRSLNQLLDSPDRASLEKSFLTLGGVQSTAHKIVARFPYNLGETDSQAYICGDERPLAGRFTLGELIFPGGTPAEESVYFAVPDSYNLDQFLSCLENLLPLLCENRVRGVILNCEYDFPQHVQELINYFGVKVYRTSGMIEIDEEVILGKNSVRSGNIMAVQTETYKTEFTCFNCNLQLWTEAEEVVLESGFNYGSFKESIISESRELTYDDLILEHNRALASYQSLSNRSQYSMFEQKTLDSMVLDGLRANILFELILERATSPEDAVLDIATKSMFLNEIPELSGKGYRYVCDQDGDLHQYLLSFFRPGVSPDNIIIAFWAKPWEMRIAQSRNYFSDREWQNLQTLISTGKAPKLIQEGEDYECGARVEPYKNKSFQRSYSGRSIYEMRYPEYDQETGGIAYLWMRDQIFEQAILHNQRVGDFFQFLDKELGGKPDWLHWYTHWDDHAHDFSDHCFGAIAIGIEIPKEHARWVVKALSQYEEARMVGSWPLLESEEIIQLTILDQNENGDAWRKAIRKVAVV